MNKGFNFYHSYPPVGPPQIIHQPGNMLNLVPGGDVKLTVTATTDAGNLMYQWKLERDGVPTDIPEGVHGATTNTLTIDDVQEEHTGEYSCEVRNDAGVTTSNAAQLTLRECL